MAARAFLLRSTLFSLVALTALGCTPRGRGGGGNGGTGDGGGGGSSDADEDGLIRSFEELVGTDPDLADTDEDGYTDGEEYLAFFDPLDPSDYPYEGDYVRLPQPTQDAWDELSADAGWGQNDFSRDWSGEDQHGQPLSLRRFYGQVILIDISAEWCGPCRAAAARLQSEYEARRDEGFVAFTILTEDPGGGGNPSADRWLQDFGLTSPVVEDGGFDIAQRYLSNAYPTYTILDRNHRIVSLDAQGGEANWNLIDDLLAEDPPEVDYPLPE